MVLTKTINTMKKKRVLVGILPVLGILAVSLSTTLTSCSDCCTVLGVKVCKGDYDPASYGGVTWEEWKEAAGC